MANLKASIKSIRKTEAKTLYNKRIKRRLATQIKAFNKLVAAGDDKNAKSTFEKVTQMLDKAKRFKVIENADRKKSRLQIRLNKLTATNEQTAE